MTGLVEESNHNRAQSLKDNQQLAERIVALKKLTKNRLSI